MKLKLRLDRKTILEFLLQNVEKMGLGIVVFVFLLMVYSALSGVERYGRTPDQLIQAVTAGRETIERTPAPSDLTVRDYAAQAKRSRVPIEEKPYTNSVLWDPALFPKRPLRSAPALLAARKLRGTAEVGAMKFTGKGNKVRGQRWVVLTALVSVEKQKLAFDELKNSVFHDPQEDCPKYLGYWVQRLEVAGPGEATELDWEKVPPPIVSKMAVAAAKKNWGQAGVVEVVPSEYIEDELVFPLGPLVGRLWGESVTHPEILLQGAEKPGLGTGGGGADGMPGHAQPAAPGGGAAGVDNPFGGPEESRPRKPSRAAPPEAPKNVQEKGPPAYKLFRYFDFHVEPGKHYVYRVRLVLGNPNWRLRSAYLKDPKLARQFSLKTKWSDPSPVISVPRDTRVLAVSVQPGRYNIDFSGRILVAKWVQQRGVEAFKEFSIVRGRVANFPHETFQPAAGEAFSVDYFSQVVVVDFRGGRRLPHRSGHSLRLTAVGEMLLLDADGSLVVRNELDDKPAREQFINGARTRAAGGSAEGIHSGASSRGGLESLEGPAARRKAARRLR